MKSTAALRRKGVRSILSPLEADVLMILWENRDRTLYIRDIHNKLKTQGIALTSIAVALNRLHKKKLVNRKMKSCRGGYRYLYRATKTKQEFERSIVENTVNRLIDSFGSVAVSYFNEKFSRKKRT